MSTPTEYKIEKLNDFLTVPDDRLDNCLAEFKECIAEARFLLTLANAMADIVGEDKSLNVLESFTWIDDGKKDVSVTIVAHA